MLLPFFASFGLISSQLERLHLTLLALLHHSLNKSPEHLFLDVTWVKTWTPARVLNRFSGWLPCGPMVSLHLCSPETWYTPQNIEKSASQPGQRLSGRWGRRTRQMILVGGRLRPGETSTTEVGRRVMSPTGDCRSHLGPTRCRPRRTTFQSHGRPVRPSKDPSFLSGQSWSNRVGNKSLMSGPETSEWKEDEPADG